MEVPYLLCFCVLTKYIYVHMYDECNVDSELNEQVKKKRDEAMEG